MMLYMPTRLTLKMIRTMQHRKFPLEINLLTEDDIAEMDEFDEEVDEDQLNFPVKISVSYAFGDD